MSIYPRRIPLLTWRLSACHLAPQVLKRQFLLNARTRAFYIARTIQVSRLLGQGQLSMQWRAADRQHSPAHAACGWRMCGATWPCAHITLYTATSTLSAGLPALRPPPHPRRRPSSGSLWPACLRRCRCRRQAGARSWPSPPWLRRCVPNSLLWAFMQAVQPWQMPAWPGQHTLESKPGWFGCPPSPSVPRPPPQAMAMFSMPQLTLVFSTKRVFYKQRDARFFPPFAYAASFVLTQMPVSTVGGAGRGASAQPEGQHDCPCRTRQLHRGCPARHAAAPVGRPPLLSRSWCTSAPATPPRQMYCPHAGRRRPPCTPSLCTG